MVNVVITIIVVGCRHATTTVANSIARISCLYVDKHSSIQDSVCVNVNVKKRILSH